MVGTPRRWSVLLLALSIFLFAACTRERELPDPTATSAVAEVSATQAPAREPAVTPAPGAADVADATPTTTATPTPEQQTFQYTVQPGETLLIIAEKFGTDVATIRQLNRLPSDAIGVGQPLNVPYTEGMTGEGLPTPTPGPFIYTIQPGDTLSAIGARFNVDTISIVEANTLLTPDNLTVGSQILIPDYQPVTTEGAAAAEGETTTGTAASGGTVVHVVQPGEGIFEIAQAYGVTEADIVAANNIADVNLVRVGQELLIPGVSPLEAAAARGTVHVVQPGESLLGIAVRYGVTVEEILAVNQIDNPDALAIGQQLIIPAQ